MSERAGPDWERIESDYRAGLLSLREIATKDGRVTEGAIRKRAKRDSWDRDLSVKIQAKADALVRKEMVRSEVRSERKNTDKEIIQSVGEIVAGVQISQRKDIARARGLVVKLLEELEFATDNLDVLEELGDAMRDPERFDKRAEAYAKVISTAGRVASLKSLSEALKNLVNLEREAYGMDKGFDDPGDSKPVEPTEAVRRIAFALAKGVAQPVVH